ncbi:uncharacterized protein LOC129753854 [Uranotaenia lowii]|uniref:uncharacterized protein LOC129753854 n=1 Tax=Uranotaenia lowii TaxID=190385 RepID=UPI002479AA21|nr:uncharacterized protein LOC129753854 [Uranotaenia lowii]
MATPPRGPKKSAKKKDSFTKTLDGHVEGSKFLIIKRASESSTFDNVSPFLINKFILANVGEVESVKKINGGSLLVQAKNIRQANKLLNLTVMQDMEIIVEEHRSLNKIKGVITCGDLKNASEEEILAELKSQGVCEVKIIKRKVDGKLTDTNSFILTFNSTTLPETIRASFYRLSVRQYIAKPMRCTKCQLFGHYKKICRNPEVCSQCCLPGHTSDKCEGQVVCRNCQSNSHPSWSSTCDIYKQEQAIQKMMVMMKLSYRAARRKYAEEHPSSITYRDVVAQGQMKALSRPPTTERPMIIDSTPDPNSPIIPPPFPSPPHSNTPENLQSSSSISLFSDTNTSPIKRALETNSDSDSDNPKKIVKALEISTTHLSDSPTNH